MPGKALVVDANILVRAVLGRRVREIIETYAEQASYFVPEVAYAEAEEHLPALVIKRGGDPDKALKFLRSLRGLVDLIECEVYSDFESTARERRATGIRTTGRYWLRRWHSAVRSGRKTPTSSDAVCPPGPPAESACFCASLKGSQAGSNQLCFMKGGALQPSFSETSE